MNNYVKCSTALREDLVKIIYSCNLPYILYQGYHDKLDALRLEWENTRVV